MNDIDVAARKRLMMIGVALLVLGAVAVLAPHCPGSVSHLPLRPVTLVVH